MLEIFQNILDFINSDSFWEYHGLFLSVFWIVGAALGIYIKRKNTELHLLSFAIVDYGTLFFAGAALYRIWPELANFFSWKFIKQMHIGGGLTLVIFIILQHIGGMIAYYTKKPNKNHRKFGRIIANFGRIITILGWVFTKNYELALGVSLIWIISITYFKTIGKKKID